MYNGQVTLVFDEKTHRYYADGKIVPGVTSILGVISKGDALTQWAANCAVDYVAARLSEENSQPWEEIARGAKRAFRGVKSEAAESGKQAHGFVEGYLLCQMAGTMSDQKPEDPKVLACFEDATSWLATNGIVPLEVERRVYSRKYHFAGTVDLIADWAGQLVLIDWKSGSNLYPEYELQTAAYVAAYQEETGQKISSRVLNKIGGVFESKIAPNSQFKDFQAFLAAKKLYHWLSENKRK